MTNIFLQPYSTPDQTIPFSLISEGDYEQAFDTALQEAYADIDRIADNPEPPTFSNTLEALNNSSKSLDRLLNAFFPLSSSMATPKMMELQNIFMPKLTAYSLHQLLNPKLWERIKNIYDNAIATGNPSKDTEQFRLLENLYLSYKRQGALLGEEDKKKLQEISEELSRLSTTFSHNVLNEINSMSLEASEDEVSGIPEDILAEARKKADSQGKPSKLIFGFDQPTYMTVMKWADNDALRKRYYLDYSRRNTKGERNNLPIIARMAELRMKMAQLLGYPDFATYSQELKMAHNPDNVYDLLYKLRDAYREALDKEIAELESNATEKITPWNYSYHANRLKQQRYNLNEEELRPYFPLDRVTDAVFKLANKFYGIDIKPRTDIDIYHPDVKVWEVTDSDGSYLGLLYTDFFPRDTKRAGAWMTEFREQRINSEGSDERPHVNIVMNFTKPTADKPSLLTPREVETLMHEFGHALHSLLSKCRYASLSGTNVKRDFVELPSQFNESFLTDREFLDLCARHYITGEPLPEAMRNAIIASSTFGAAYQCMRQLNFGLVDMAWHTLRTPEDCKKAADNPIDFERKAGESVRIFDAEPDGCCVSPQFSHIFAGGYSAGYYSYKWAEVLAADAHEAVAPNGENSSLDLDAAKRFRREILEKGDTVSPDILYRNFRGHDADVTALLRRDHLA